MTTAQLNLIDLRVEPPSDVGNWLTFLGSLLPLVFIGALFFFLLRQAQGGNNQAMAFGKSRARMFTGDKPTVTFACEPRSNRQANKTPLSHDKGDRS